MPVRGSGCGSSWPHGEGFVGGSPTVKCSYFPCLCRTKVTSPRCLTPFPHQTRTAAPWQPPYLGGSACLVTSELIHRLRWPNELRCRANPQRVWRGATAGPWGLFLGLGCSGSLRPRGRLAARPVTVTPGAVTRLQVRAGGGRGDGIARRRGAALPRARLLRGRAGHPLLRLRLRLLHGWGCVHSLPATAPRGSGSRHGKPEGIRAAAVGATRAALPPGGDGGGGSSSSSPVPGEAPSPPGSAGCLPPHPALHAVQRLLPAARCPQLPAAPGPMPAARPDRDDVAEGPGELPAPYRGFGQPPAQTLPNHQY